MLSTNTCGMPANLLKLQNIICSKLMQPRPGCNNLRMALAVLVLLFDTFTQDGFTFYMLIVTADCAVKLQPTVN